ncbi:MAG TPA: PAS domain S-box protein [Rectinemataceae bacterium]|nr:PAS domain S-box protein [Rectinemataceae bacterium]
MKAAGTILLVEDEAVIALAERRSLEGLGYGVLVAADGAAAVELAAQRPDIDLILLDINLGEGIDGTQAAQRILAFRELPIVFLSSHTERSIVEKTETITSYGYVVKNSGVTVLDASIKMAFKLFDANQRLKRTMHRLEATLDALPDLLFELDLEGRYHEVHARQSESLYRSREEILGQTLHEVLPRDAAEVVQSALCEAFETGRSTGRQYKLKLPAGERWFEVSISRIAADLPEPRFMMLARDITERKSVEESLRREGYLLQVLMNSSLVHIYFKDLESRFIMASASTAELFGVGSSDQLVGKTDFDLFTKEHAQQAYEDEQNIIRTGEALKKEERETWEGMPDTWVLTEKMPLRDRDGSVMGIFGISSDITERKRAEEALREREERYRSLFENAPVGIFYSTVEGKEISVNAEYARIFGFDSPEELISIVNQRTTADIIFDRPEVRSRLIGRALANVGSWIRTEQEYRRRDGSHVLTNLAFRALPENPDVMEGFVEDISERKAAETSLRRSEARIRNFILSANVGTWELDVQTGGVRIDQKSLELLGYAVGEVSFDTLDDWFLLKHPEDRESTRRVLQQYIEGRTEFYSSESRMRHRDGTWLWILARGKIVERGADGKPLLMYGIHMDITERKRAEERIRNLLAEKETLLREVHHRVKNSMGTVYSLLDLQAASTDEPRVAAVLEDAGRRIQSMLLLYEELYRAERFERASVKDFLSFLVDTILETFPLGDRVRAEKRIGDFDLDVRRLQPLGIIVNELLTNAMKYAFVGRPGGTLLVSAERVRESIVVVVQDDGVGLPPDPGTSSASGLGLSLVDSLVKQIGARLSVERGSGTRFVIEFSSSPET